MAHGDESPPYPVAERARDMSWFHDDRPFDEVDWVFWAARIRVESNYGGRLEVLLSNGQKIYVRSRKRHRPPHTSNPCRS